ncbi:CheY-like chemotaxis protein [Siphonobacter sp. SORGH_AS 1065]|nr:CheY-like chemotaxis protein [Siphonobacter sp. SORGH_AS_1065]
MLYRSVYQIVNPFMSNSPLLLVVEDDEDDREFLQSVVEKSDHPCELIFAHDGQHALEILRDLSPQMIITDINMPRMNGLELLERLRSMQQWLHIPVLFLTTSQGEETVKEAYLQGANSYITKPSTQDGLVLIWDQIYRYWIELNKTAFN